MFSFVVKNYINCFVTQNVNSGLRFMADSLQHFSRLTNGWTFT